MFRWFESRLDPYPGDRPQMPPRSFWGFSYYSHGALPWLVLLALGSPIAAIEVMLFGYLGDRSTASETSPVQTGGSSAGDGFAVIDRPAGPTPPA